VVGRGLLIVLAVGLATGCSANVSEPTSATRKPDSTPSTSQPSSSPTSAGGPDSSVNVDWGDGLNPPGMSAGVPNPKGWYQSAFGTRTTDKTLYLTFDDGPWPPYTQEILALLKKYNDQATFFVVGTQTSQYPELLKAEIAGGNAIGDHTLNHPRLTDLSHSEVKHQLTAVQKDVGSDLGACMRPPYGLISDKVADVAGELGMTPILWTGHATDWDQPPVEQMVTDLKKATEPGAVILLHDGGGSREHTTAALKSMLPWWKGQGYSLKPVPACIAK